MRTANEAIAQLDPEDKTRFVNDFNRRRLEHNALYLPNVEAYLDQDRVTFRTKD